MNKSHRDIKGETLNDFREVADKVKPEVEKVTGHKIPERKPSKSYFRKMKLKKISNFLLKTLAAENGLGEILHGAMDISFIPNQWIAKKASEKLQADPYLAQRERKKLFSKRNWTSLVVFAILLILMVSGKITIENMIAIWEIAQTFM